MRECCDLGGAFAPARAEDVKVVERTVVGQARLGQGIDQFAGVGSRCRSQGQWSQRSIGGNPTARCISFTEVRGPAFTPKSNSIRSTPRGRSPQRIGNQ